MFPDRSAIVNSGKRPTWPQRWPAPSPRHWAAKPPGFEVWFRPDSTMKILVTGGAGFIGANFLNLLVPRHPEHAFVNLDALTYAANPAQPGRARRAGELRLRARRPGRLRGRARRASPSIGPTWSCTSRPRATSTAPSPGRGRSCAPTSRAPSTCSRPAASCGKAGEGLFHHVSHRRGLRLARRRRAASPRRRATIRRAPTRRPRRRAITWCAPGTAPSACPSSSPTARTTTGPCSFPRSSSRS